MRFTFIRSITFIFGTASFVGHCFCTPTNITIDDQIGDTVTGQQVSYIGGWNQGNECSFCSAKPDASDTFGQTWHDGTFTPGTSPSQYGFTFQFNGTAIWVYGVVETGVYTEISFSVDGQETGGPFVSNRTGDSGFLYNQTMFSIEGLDPGTHIVTGSLSGSASKSQVIFDWAEYTTDIDDPKKHSSRRSAIIGGTVGGLAGLIMVVAGLLFLYRRRRVSPYTVDPFPRPSDNDSKLPQIIQPYTEPMTADRLLFLNQRSKPQDGIPYPQTQTQWPLLIAEGGVVSESSRSGAAWSEILDERYTHPNSSASHTHGSNGSVRPGVPPGLSETSSRIGRTGSPLGLRTRTVPSSVLDIRDGSHTLVSVPSVFAPSAAGSDNWRREEALLDLVDRLREEVREMRENGARSPIGNNGVGMRVRSGIVETSRGDGVAEQSHPHGDYSHQTVSGENDFGDSSRTDSVAEGP